ncbi:hypothetical protein BLD48_10010 [Exiguobacterium sp. KRL4]|uniref:hypothetical protein n=1 Tax=Exiguobacterium sp. KRL4 TaxID=1914536 RepID=UPI0008F8BD9F|nr:hypothetical protein [Exiguobacterium sp. KRL4]OIN66640.1 hypothetical protein BLD48_10010 [Exiguobacterium sp. KRL4]
MKNRLLLTTGLYLLVMLMTIYAIFFEQSDSTFLLIIQLGLLIHFYFQYRMSYIVPDQDVPTAPFRLNVLRTGLIVAAFVSYILLDSVPLLLATAVALAFAVPTLVSYLHLRTQED